MNAPLPLFALTAPASEATFSPDRRYRYTLTRTWDDQIPAVAFIGLNPSTADETKDDPTIRRCIGFAKRWGCGGIVMLNLFAFRATDPRVMKQEFEPVGVENDEVLAAFAQEHTRIQFIVAAWGKHGEHHGRGDAVAKMIARRRVLMCLGKNLDGSPVHPLYVPAARPLEIFRSFERGAS